VWFKRTDVLTIDLKRLSDGRLIAAPVLTPGFGVSPESGYDVMGLDGVVDETRINVDPDDFPSDFHDYEELTALGGEARAVLSYPLVRNQDLTALGDGFGSDESIVDGVIQEIDADGDLVWDWRASDHFGYDEVTFPNRFGFYPGEDEVDVFHLNSVDQVDDGTGDYVVSVRHTDAVVRIDRASGDLDWILSSTPTSAPNKGGGQRLTIVDDPFGGPLRMHDARFDGDLLTMYDNRTGNLNGDPARFVEYEIDADAGTATMVRQILQPEGEQSLALGGARVTDDDTVIVSWSQTQPMFSEYAADGTELMRLTMDPSDWAYRIVKYGPDDFDADALRAGAGGSIGFP